MSISITILTAQKPPVLKIITLLEKQGNRVNCFSGSNSVDDFLSQPPETFDLLIIDEKLPAADISRVIEQITSTENSDTVPVLFVVKPVTKGTRDETMSSYLQDLQPGRYDFIDSDPDPLFLNARISVLLEFGKLQKKLDNAISEISYFGGLGHDLRNPVHGILSYAGFGIKKGESGKLTEEKSHHYFQSIRDAGNRLLDLLEDIILLAKLDAGDIPFEMSERNLWTVTQGVLTELYRRISAEQISLNCNEPESPALSHFDFKQTGGLIKRLINCCLQTAENDTELTLTVKSLDETADDNRLNRPAICFMLQHPDADFSDQRLDDLQYLFNHGGHSRGTKGHAGVSFAICQRIIARHNGCIWVEKHSAGGIVFGFMLPR